jgi:RNA polymerase sigma-70 factor (ECF subfamily)
MEELVKRKIKEIHRGDKNAFGDIVEFYKDKVFQICFRMVGNRSEAEDIAQETFIRAYINIGNYNMDKKFSTWLYRIATNLCIDRLRKKKADYSLDAEVTGTEGLTMYSQIPSADPLPEDAVAFMELQDFLQRELLALPEKYRTAIILKYMEELSLNEISEILDLPVGTVKTHIHRGREALRKRLRHL